MTLITHRKAIAPAKVKAEGQEEETGSFKALVATYDVDSVGDKIMPGAFAKSLARWEESGTLIPVIWSHDWGDPFSHIGAVIEAKETDDGLLIDGVLDLDEPKAAKVYKLMKGKRISNFSFAYDILDASPAKADGADILELRELDLFEVGPCLVGVNRQTELLDIKGDPYNFTITTTASSSFPTKKAVASHSTDVVDRAWDGPEAEAALPAEATASDYRTVYAWNDPDGDPDTQAGWKFIHHHGIGGPANVRACITGIGVLNGGRGGTTIPDADRRGVYNHLAKHLRDGDVEPPELKGFSARLWRASLGLPLTS